MHRNEIVKTLFHDRYDPQTAILDIIAPIPAKGLQVSGIDEICALKGSGRRNFGETKFQDF